MVLIERDYVAADTAGARIIIYCIVLSWLFPTIVTFAVAGRFAARKIRRTDWGWDDWAILASLVWDRSVLVEYGGLH